MASAWRAAFAACIVLFCLPAVAQTYPDHPIRIIVPQPPGGGFDAVARVVADRLQAILGQPVVVDNRPGAGTLVGTDLASKAPADGYTLLLGGLVVRIGSEQIDSSIRTRLTSLAQHIAG